MATGESDIAAIVVEGVYEGTLGHLDKGGGGEIG